MKEIEILEYLEIISLLIGVVALLVSLYAFVAVSNYMISLRHERLINLKILLVGGLVFYGLLCMFIMVMLLPVFTNPKMIIGSVLLLGVAGASYIVAKFSGRATIDTDRLVESASHNTLSSMDAITTRTRTQYLKPVDSYNSIGPSLSILDAVGVIIENQNLIYVVFDEKGNFLAVSDIFTKLMGWTMEDLKEYTFIDLVHPEDREGTISAYSKGGKVRTGKVDGEELYEDSSRLAANRYRIKGTDEYRWIIWTSNSSPYEEANLTFAIIGPSGSLSLDDVIVKLH